MSEIQNNNKLIPYVKIIEQPSNKGVRFRYQCERKFAGSILGVNSTNNQRSFPTIEIFNYEGPAYIIVSCVTKDPPYWPHPHNLVGKSKQVSNGICYYKKTTSSMAVTFPNLGIQCVKRTDVVASLAIRKKLKVDPFNTGFSHMDKPDNINLYCLRLCFQVFIEGSEEGKFNVPLEPVVTDEIHDRRIRIEPVINFISHTSAPVAGGTEMCILCERATKEDIQVRFFREENRWEEIAEFTPPKVFKKVSIVFKSPKYITQNIDEPVNVKIQIRRISDGEFSEPIPFQFLPDESHAYKSVKRKRSRNNYVAEQIQEEAKKNAELISLAQTNDPNMPSTEPWELPLYLTGGFPGQMPLFDSNSNNELFVPRHEANEHVEPTSEFQYCNIPNDSFGVLNNQPVNRLPFNITHEEESFTHGTELPTYQQQWQQNQNSSDTLNTDSWIKELLETINKEDTTLTDISNNIRNTNKIAYEPETNFINIDSNNQYLLL